jgi:branched-chain amino acid transport system permease protein
MEAFLQQVVSGLATGGAYAGVALALVLVTETGIINFAQGEFAMISVFIAWTLLQCGVNYWLAFAITLALSLAVGVLIERTLMRPLEGAPHLNSVMATMGLMAILNSGAGFTWGYTIKSFPTPFPEGALWLGGVALSIQHLCVFGVTMILLLLVFGFLRFTKLGLALRAAHQDPQSCRLMGVRVGWIFALGWGLAAFVGASAGIMIAPIVFLDPSMMLGPLLYALAGATLGGWDSPGGAVFGGLLVGVIQNLVGTYVPFIGPDLSFGVALVLIVGVLLLKPAGLFGRVRVRRV